MKKLVSLICALCMVIALAIPAAACGDDGIMPLLEPHCGNGSTKIGYLKETVKERIIATETRPCQHGSVGLKDVRYLHEITHILTCTRCDYYDDSWVETYYSDWLCE